MHSIPVLQYLIIGYGILIAAILLNMLAGILHLSTRYDVFHKFSSTGMNATLKSVTTLSRIFLLGVYPLMLGVTGWYMSRFLSSLG